MEKAYVFNRKELVFAETKGTAMSKFRTKPESVFAVSADTCVAGIHSVLDQLADEFAGKRTRVTTVSNPLFESVDFGIHNIDEKSSKVFAMLQRCGAAEIYFVELFIQTNEELRGYRVNLVDENGQFSRRFIYEQLIGVLNKCNIVAA